MFINKKQKMSGNIHDTKVDLIHKQVNDLIKDLDKILKNGEKTSNYENDFIIKYKYLIDTSNTLYKYICSQMNSHYKDDNFNQDKFKERLNLMLNAILNIQKSNITQHEASVILGEKLASEYIPFL